MPYRDQRIYIGLPEAIDSIARSYFGGSHPEAWKDIHTAWQDGAVGFWGIVFQGRRTDREARFAQRGEIGFDGDKRTRIFREDGKFFLYDSGRMRSREIDGLEMKRCHLEKFWPAAEAALVNVEENGGREPAYYTRLAGRPSIRHLIETEHVRRANAGEIVKDLSDEAAALQNWAGEHHPDFPTPALGTIKNHIRLTHRKLLADNPTK